MKLTRSLIAATAMVALSAPAFADGNQGHIPAIQKVAQEGLSVMVLGSGGPMATVSGRASAGYLIFVDGEPRALMDAGGGTYARLAESGTFINKLDLVLLSHLHADHTGDLTPIIKTLYFHNRLLHTTRDATTPIRIFGPEANGVGFPFAPLVPQYPATSEYADGSYKIPNGVDRYLNLFATAITSDSSPDGPSKFVYQTTDLTSVGCVNSLEDLTPVVNDADGFVVKSAPVDHGPVPSVAFRIEYKGHVVVYSGDTGTGSAPMGGNPTYACGMNNMQVISADADMLIYDTAITNTAPATPLFHVLHSEPWRIGTVANAAGVDTLVLSHITPISEPQLGTIKTDIQAVGYTGDIEVAEDLEVYNLGN